MVEIAASVTQAGALGMDVEDGVPDVVLDADDGALDAPCPGVVDAVPAGAAVVVAGVSSARTTCAGGPAVRLAVVVPEMRAGPTPPAVARLATMPSTTEPFGMLVADATTAWATGVADTWAMSCMLEPTGLAVTAAAACEPLAAPAESTCEVAARAESPAPEKTRRNAARADAVRKSGSVARVPEIAPAPFSACWSVVRARWTRARAFVLVIPSVPATSS